MFQAAKLQEIYQVSEWDYGLIWCFPHHPIFLFISLVSFNKQVSKTDDYNP